MADEGRLPIVAIGAATNEPRTLRDFLAMAPRGVGAAYVAVSDPECATQLTQQAEMAVHVVAASTELQPDVLHVIPRGHRASLSGRTLHVHGPGADEPASDPAPVDGLLDAVAKDGRDVFAVILASSGLDGARGVRSIKEAGGIILVQDPREAVYPSIALSAMAASGADVVLPLGELAARLGELLQIHSEQERANPQDEEDTLRRILAHVRVRTGHDFSQYKRATILRRIVRRAQVARKSHLSEYFSYIRDNPEESFALFSDFLISVTSFFRDPKAFQFLAGIIRQIFDSNDLTRPIRVWVPAAATGEEAYTIAMLLLEEGARRPVRPEIQVFGSDLDEASLAVAREGRFPATIQADVSEERLQRFFIREGDFYRVRRELRDIVLFAGHSLLRDPPFSRLDLISCRNLLIYLDRDLQQQVCSTFHYALNPGGFLLLGSSEAVDQPPGLFRPVDRDSRLYRSTRSASDKRPMLPLTIASTQLTERGNAPARSPSGATSGGDAALHRQMLEKVAPPSILVDADHRAIHLSETAGRFLQPSGGSLTMDVTDLVRQELRFDLRTALHRAFERGEPTLTMPILVRFNGSRHRTYMHVRPVVQSDDPAHYALILFIEGEAAGEDVPGGEARTLPESVQDRIRHLEEELQLAQTRLRAMREESEAATEELRAANEELQSINEEYRSTSEELETSKEELQSINEELQTVNNELKIKLESVSRAHSDLQNFMAATDVATLFLDPALRIKRFTPRLSEIFNVTRTDEGRPITDFTHQLEYEELAAHAQTVLRNLAPLEHEVQARGGGWYLVRIRPYRTIEDKIDGIVMTFVDISERRRTEEALRANEERLRQAKRLVDLSRAPIFVWRFDGGILEWNRGSETLYGYSRDEAVGQRKEQLLQTAVPGSSFETVRAKLLETGTWTGELNHRTKDGRILVVESRIELVSLESGQLVLESTWDITDRKRWEERQKLLLGELTHRVKNTLAVVQSLARQTMRAAGSSAEFLSRFEGRLSALAAAHGLLVESEWHGAELEALARAQLRALGTRDGGRLLISGPPITLPPDLATPFGLVLHELGTNAAKYGALSNEAGRISLTWSLEQRNKGAAVRVVWQELGGPPVAAVERRGLGSTLIERAIPDAEVLHELRPDGAQCTMTLGLPEEVIDGLQAGIAPPGRAAHPDRG